MQTVLYAIILLFATFLWGYAFYKKDYHPKPLRTLVQIFTVGLFSMIPIFGYQYLYEHFFPFLAEYQIFTPLINQPVLKGFMAFGFNLVVLVVFFYFISAILTGLLTRFKHETLENIHKSVREGDEPLCFIATSMLIGMMVFFSSILEGHWGIALVGASIGSILVLTVMEEYVKHLMVRFVDDKKIEDVDDAMTFSIMVGLAFAFIETLFYGISSGDMSLIIYRSFLTIPIHLIASGIFGYYYGLAHFAKPLTRKQKPLHLKLFHHLFTFKRSTVYREEKMVEGLVLATLFHGGCNVLFELNLAFLVVPIIVAGLFIISNLYKEGHLLYKLIHSH